jgi:drug/metabolite transporter (DMT)-like permease
VRPDGEEVNLEASGTDGREGGGAGTADARFGAVEWMLLGLTALIWGAAFLLIDVAVEHLQPAVLSLLWVAVGAGTLVFFPSARRPVSPADLPALGLLGATWMAAPFLLFAAAEQAIDSAVAGMLDGATPLFTALVAFAVSPARPAPRSAAAALGCLGGALANAAFAVLLDRVGPTRASVAVYFPPSVAIGLGALVRHDRVSPISVVGTGIMLYGAWLVTRGGDRRLSPGGAEGTTSARADLVPPTQAS